MHTLTHTHMGESTGVLANICGIIIEINVHSYAQKFTFAKYYVHIKNRNAIANNINNTKTGNCR